MSTLGYDRPDPQTLAARPGSAADGVIVGRIFFTEAAFEGRQWVWTLAYGFHEDRTPTHGYEPTREAAMAAFAKNWRREEF